MQAPKEIMDRVDRIQLELTKLRTALQEQGPGSQAAKDAIQAMGKPIAFLVTAICGGSTIFHWDKLPE